jgi:hypothetical protein
VNDDDEDDNNFEVESDSLGIRNAVMSPTGSFLAIGGYDSTIRLYVPGSRLGISSTYPHRGDLSSSSSSSHIGQGGQGGGHGGGYKDASSAAELSVIDLEYVDKYTENGVPIEIQTGRISSLSGDRYAGGFFDVEGLEEVGRRLMGMSVDTRRRRVDPSNAKSYIQGAPDNNLASTTTNPNNTKNAGSFATQGKLGFGRLEANDPSNMLNWVNNGLGLSPPLPSSWGGVSSDDNQQGGRKISGSRGSSSSGSSFQQFGGACALDIPPGFSSKLPQNLPYIKPDFTTPHPRTGVLRLGWSPSGRYLASKDESLPTTIFIWDTWGQGLKAVICFRTVVRGFRWSPGFTRGGVEGRLAVVTGVNRVFLWEAGSSSSTSTTSSSPSPKSKSSSSTNKSKPKPSLDRGGVKWIDLPEGMNALALRWRGDGNVVCVLGAKSYIRVYLDDEEEEDGDDGDEEGEGEGDSGTTIARG